jgi:hypothetical protein
MRNFKKLILVFASSLLLFSDSLAQNPIIRDQFSADPTARVFNGKVYLFPSHDIPAPKEMARKDWFVMEDYHVFSSTNLNDWTDHGVIVSQGNVPWVNATTYSMWAPDCVERNGKYYFYFPANVKAGTRRGFGIGVAVADKPEGPYIPQPEPIKNVNGIDPCTLIDKDGQAYIYFSQGRIFGAKLNENMVELASDVQVMADLPTKGLIEGPFVFERNGIYYMTYPHVQDKIERLEYAISNNPLGPFKFTGVIMDESPTGCWTSHHSLVEYNKQWYLFYHNNDYSPKFDKNRSVRVDSLSFNDDGTIRKVIPTFRGVGLTLATNKIEIDRYSSKSEPGVTISFLDTLNTFKGWKTVLAKPNAMIQYNAVDFGNNKIKSITVNAFSTSGGTIEVRQDKPDGAIIAEIKIPAGTGWSALNGKMLKYKKGIHNLVVVLKGNNPVEVDWLQFNK